MLLTRSSRCLNFAIKAMSFAWVGLAWMSTSLHAAVLWQSGWENATGTVATCQADVNDPLTDRFSWNGDYGPGNNAVCSATPDIATLSTTRVHSGTKSLQVHFKDNDGNQGPDFRIIRNLGSNRNDTYFRFYVFYSSEWVWSASDHKQVILGEGNQVTQDVYFNIRRGVNNRAGRLAIATIPSDCVFGDSTNGVLVPGQWHLVEGHIVSGSNGRIEARLNGVPLTLVNEAGPCSTPNPNNANTGAGIGYLKLDTTYNCFQPTSQGCSATDNFMANNAEGFADVYYDDVAVCDTTWCGPVGGTTPPPPPSPPPPPPPPPPTGGLFFNEGWESGTLAQSFNSSGFGNFGNQYSVQTNTFASGTRGLQHIIPQGTTGDNTQWGTQHFGDSPTPPLISGTSGNHYQDIYVQYKVRYPTGFNFSGGIKQIEIGQQDDQLHTNTCCNPWVSNYVTFYVDGSGNFRVEANNKQDASNGPNQWLNLSPNMGTTPIPVQTNRWYTIEGRIRLNDANQDNGVFQMWIDGTQVANYTTLRYRIPFNGTFGSNFSYNTNFVMISDYSSPASPQTRNIFYDDFKLSTSYIGTGTTPPPPPPTNACDLNNANGVNVIDVQLCANQAIGVTPCTSGDIDGNSQCNVIDVQRVVNAALGGACVTQ